MSKARWWRNYWRNSSITVREYFPRAKLFAFVRLSLWSRLKHSFMPTLELVYGTLARRTWPAAWVLLLLVLSLGAVPARGQTYLIAGRITDGTNGGVSGVTVQAVVTNQTQTPLSSMTDGSGNYSILLLQ